MTPSSLKMMEAVRVGVSEVAGTGDWDDVPVPEIGAGAQGRHRPGSGPLADGRLANGEAKVKMSRKGFWLVLKLAACRAECTPDAEIPKAELRVFSHAAEPVVGIVAPPGVESHARHPRPVALTARDDPPSELKDELLHALTTPRRGTAANRAPADAAESAKYIVPAVRKNGLPRGSPGLLTRRSQSRQCADIHQRRRWLHARSPGRTPTPLQPSHRRPGNARPDYVSTGASKISRQRSCVECPSALKHQVPTDKTLRSEGNGLALGAPIPMAVHGTHNPRSFNIPSSLTADLPPAPRDGLGAAYSKRFRRPPSPSPFP
ncbi:MAG: hypothetical protein BJ554DRAFT_7452 [Olpidium bornovanus]|uniref:Uncharacterized protein n=1 Tax=Olpidium bornovanus TaxID=278681 RepID=A0A8H8DJ43_9FUNG|nr:MAG: hypothetical protein BJ554DRAFT_7452 [Olpidium bornovanus]